jgi:hypothetical protein
VKRSGGNEQHMVRPYRSVPRLHGRPLDDRQKIALHPLSAHVDAMRTSIGSADLVELVDKDDAAAFGQSHGLFGDGIAVHQILDFLLEQNLPRLADLHLPFAALAGHQPLEHVLEVNIHLLQAHVRKNLHRDPPLLDVELNLAVFELAGPEHFAELVARAILAFFRLADVGVVFATGLGCGRHEKVNQPLLDAQASLVFDFTALVGLDQRDGRLDEVAGHALDVAPVIADLGVLRGLHLDEGRADELRQTPRDFRLPHAGGSDHDDVLGRHFLAHLGRKLPPAPAIADGNRHRPFRVVLPDDVLIEQGHDLARRHFRHGSSSTVISRLV